MGHQEVQRARMRCTICGADMNQHAFKIDFSGDAQGDDASFGGTLQEVHTCPACGHIELRQA